MVNFQSLHDFHGISEQNFSFFPLAGARSNGGGKTFIPKP